MVTVGLLVPLKAKPDKEEDVQRFLEGGLALVNEELDTTAWFAIRLGPSDFAIVDFFPDDARTAGYLSGRVAEALMAQAVDLFAEAPEIKPADVVASKHPG